MKPHHQKEPGGGRLILFDDAQGGILQHRLPLILMGSAGSGKTSLVLEKLKTLQGDLLYVTLSPPLVHHARRLYGDRPDAQEWQSVDFLSLSHDAWCVDITYIKLVQGFAYLTALIDVVSRKIMGWCLSPFLDAQSCLEAFTLIWPLWWLCL